MLKSRLIDSISDHSTLLIFLPKAYFMAFSPSEEKEVEPFWAFLFRGVDDFFHMGEVDQLNWMSIMVIDDPN